MPILQPKLTLILFYDWNLEDPFNLKGSGLNSRRDEGEYYLGNFTVDYSGKEYQSGKMGDVVL